MEIFLFYIFSISLLISSLSTILITNSVYSVFFLVLAFVNASGILFLLSIEFFAILFLIIYVGAIAVVFLFVVIILNLKETDRIQKKQFEFIPISIFFFIFFIFEVIFILKYDFISAKFLKLFQPLVYTNWVYLIDFSSSVTTFGQTLYTYYIIFFLLAGIILLVAIISSISLTYEYSKKDMINKQLVFEQISRIKNTAIFKVKLKNAK